MRCHSLLLLLSLPAMLPAQTVGELVTTLAAAATLDDEAIGEGGEKSATFRTFERLREKASGDELVPLLGHASPIVRGYAAQALADRKQKVDWLAILRAHALDAARVKTFRGCIQADELLGDVLIDLARDRELLGDEQWLDLAETLVQQQSPLFARERALRTLKFRAPMLPRLRELAKAGDGPAHVALARAALAADLPLLLAHLQRKDAFADDTAFLAAQLHADASLLPVLAALEPAARQTIAAGLAQRVRGWLAAIAVQQSPAAAQFLATFVKDTDPGNRPAHREVENLVKAAIVGFPDAAVFEPVRATLRRGSQR